MTTPSIFNCEWCTTVPTVFLSELNIWDKRVSVLKLSQRRLIISNRGFCAIASPVPRVRMLAFRLLLSELQQAWQEGLDNQNFWEETGIPLGDRVLSFLPSTEPIQCQKLEVEELEELFIGVISDGQLHPCHLVSMHTPLPSKVKPKQVTEEITAADIPIPPSGDDDADLFARLISVDTTVDGALSLWDRFDEVFLSCFMEQLAELRRDPEERVKEYLTERFQEWKQQNQNIYKQALGINV